MAIYCTKEKYKPHFALRKQAFSSPTNIVKVKVGIHKAEWELLWAAYKQHLLHNSPGVKTDITFHSWSIPSY